MCFEIDVNAPKPTKDVAYKLLKILSDGRFCSPYEDGTDLNNEPIHLWAFGKVKTIPEDARVEVDDQSHSGLYVFTSLKRAQQTLQQFNQTSIALVKCEALRKDFIHASYADWENFGGPSGRGATYRRLKPLELVSWHNVEKDSVLHKQLAKRKARQSAKKKGA